MASKFNVFDWLKNSSKKNTKHKPTQMEIKLSALIQSLAALVEKLFAELTVYKASLAECQSMLSIEQTKNAELEAVNKEMTDQKTNDDAELQALIDKASGWLSGGGESAGGVTA